ncbi:MAG TPA: serine/threonine-protein kinase [Polyangiaceae bacterium]|nr:serine/threonine-protein kinase [Polyangiaceae bacterium]
MIDKYQIKEMLGTGGFAVVYRAVHQLLDREVALKLLRPDVASEHPGLGAMLVDEARLAARIQHPNVVRIYDVTHSPKLTYIVMELIDGVSLARRLLLHGALEPRTALDVGIDIARGLAAGLERGLVHRDIKPANLLIGRDGGVRIVDFGMAYVRGQNDWLSSSGTVGTRGYMPPEQVKGSVVDFRADIYALGITLQESCLGRESRTDSPTRSLQRLVMPQLREVFDWMCNPDASKRPQSYDELLSVFNELKQQLDLDRARPSQRPRARESTRAGIG